MTRIEELTRLEALHKGYKYHVTCDCNKADKIFTQESLDKPAAAYFSIARFEQQTKTLERFKQVNNQIADFIEGPRSCNTKSWKQKTSRKKFQTK